MQPELKDRREIICKELNNILKKIMKDILDYGQLSLSESSFIVFRKRVLDSFGKELQEQIRYVIEKGMARAGAEQANK